MRAILCVLAVGCSGNKLSSLDARGSLGDGTPFDLQLGAAVDPSGAPWKVAATGASGPEDLRGFWLWFDPSVSQGASYSSTGASTSMGAVHFFVVRAAADGSLDASLVDGGTIAFTAGGPDNYAGTLAGLKLMRNGMPVATVDGGDFVAQRP